MPVGSLHTSSGDVTDARYVTATYRDRTAQVRSVTSSARDVRQVIHAVDVIASAWAQLDRDIKVTRNGREAICPTR